ncbi:MAG: Na(+)-translocating NADH-quinone reductase subunit C [Pseudomonadota bacterium]
MNNDSALKALLVVGLTSLLCSVVVTTAAVALKPIQRAYEDLERNRVLVGIAGLTEDAAALSDREVVSLFQDLEARIVNLDTGKFDDGYDADTFDGSADLALSVPIPPEQDLATLGQRSRLITVFVVPDGDGFSRMILPVYGQGMWSTLYGFIALDADLNTIAGITFYQQAETAGIGDQILRPDWQALWLGRKLYDPEGNLRFRVSKQAVDPALPAAAYHVDAISGATVTTDAVSNLITYWFGEHGFKPFIDSLTERSES